MSHCTQAHLVSRYGEDELIQRSDRSGLGVIDETVVDEAIARAAEDIDGALEDAGYSLPLATPWSRLRLIAEPLARYYLYTGERPKEVADDYAAAQREVARISEGKLRPPGVAVGALPADEALPGPDFVAGERVWDDAALAVYLRG